MATKQRTPKQATPAPVQAPSPMQQMAAVVTAAPGPAAAPATIALRGGLALQAVALTGKPYRVGAAHNAQWWQQCVQAVAAGNGSASVAQLVQAGVPAIFVGYVVRRGYMQPAAPAQVA